MMKVEIIFSLDSETGSRGQRGMGKRRHLFAALLQILISIYGPGDVLHSLTSDINLGGD